MRAAALAAPAALVASGCGSNEVATARWQDDFYYTHRLHIDGQHALAAQRYSTLADRAERSRDADESAMMSCEAMRRAKLAKQAASCFDELARGGKSRATRTRSLLHAAQVRYDDLGKVSDALLMFVELVKRAPTTPAGLRALDCLSRHGRASPAARADAVARMTALERADPQSQLADNLLLRAAMLLSDDVDAKQRRRAIGLLERMKERHRHSPALVPGLLLLAKLHRGFDESQAEAHALQGVVATHETSYVFGTYLEPNHLWAMQRLVSLYATKLRDPERAEAMLSRLRGVVYEPVRRFAYLAQLARIREARGDVGGAISAWQELLDAAEVARRDMRRNDERICREMDKPTATAKCLREVRRFGALPVKEVPAAKAALGRLRSAAGVRQ